MLIDMKRRVCPGRYFADASLWLIMSNILAVFDIGPPLDASGNPEVIGKLEFTDGNTRSVSQKQIVQIANRKCTLL